ncbi:MAG: hydroxyacid dehydrogenase [Clostridia bacterium]|nr:hydroxyacid dehydrogenase [Clostridia bacterium]
MKAIFLNKSAGTVRNVYGSETIAALQARCELSDTVYKKEDILANPGQFADTEVAFSTWGMPVFTEEEIKSCLPNLKCVFYGAGSVQFFARPFLACGVRVVSAWAANAVPVAEMTVAQIILGNNGYFPSSRYYSTGDHNGACNAADSCRGNYGETVGIIGAGMIGRLVIQMLKQYELKVIVFDPFLPDEKAAELGVEKCDLPTLFERAFVVSNHLANNAQTKGMLNYDLFRRMRHYGVFINTGRGAQVVEDDLVRILTERPDLTALLDVTLPEPVEPGHAFYSLPNCLLTPHIAGSKGDEIRRMGKYMLNEFDAYLAGEALKYEVSEAMLETMA